MAASGSLFASRQALQAEIDRLGVAIRLEPDIRVALTPLQVAGRTLRNRFAIHPMEGCDGTLDGRPDELTFRRWDRFARGGAALIWGEAIAVVPEGRASPRQLLLAESTLPSLERLIAGARTALGDRGRESLIGLQLTHSGRWATPTPAVAFHDTALRNNGPVVTDDELDRLQDAYVAAARRARDIGVNFVDIKQCHRYLLSELLAAKTRPGKYGGPLEHRTRFAREVIARIRADVPGLIVATRMNFFDGLPFARNPQTSVGEALAPSTPNYLEPEEALAAVAIYRDAGLQLLNVSSGCAYYNPHILRPADREPSDGYGAPEPQLVGVARHFGLTEAAHRAFPDLVVLGAGYSYLRHFALEAGEANLADGRASLVGLGRGAIAYPDFANDVTMDKHKACISVSYCTTLMRAKDNALGQYPAGCAPRDPIYAKELQEVQRHAKRDSRS